MSAWAPAGRALLRERRRGLLGLVLLLGAASVLMAFRSGSWQAERVVGGILVLAAFAPGPLLVGGLVSDDLRGGAVLLWLQKPVSPLAFYLNRLALALSVAVAVVVVLLASGWAALVLAGEPKSAELLRLAPFLVPCTLLTGLVTFTFSALGSPRDGALTFLYLLLAVPGGLMLELAPASGVSLLVDAPAWLVLFPLNELQLLQIWVVDGGAGPWSALLRVAVYGTAWLGAGILAARASVRRPFGRFPD